jgi:hypothetical protein
MTLLKPTRRDLVKAAAARVRRDLIDEGQQLARQAADRKNEAERERQQNADKIALRHTRKMQPLCDQLNDVTEAAGFGRPFTVRSQFTGCVSRGERVGKPLQVYIQLRHDAVTKMTKGKYPEDTAKVKELEAEGDCLNEESRRLHETARYLTDQDVISGGINQALNGEAATALEVLVTNIKEVALGDA